MPERLNSDMQSRRRTAHTSPSGLSPRSGQLFLHLRTFWRFQYSTRSFQKHSWAATFHVWMTRSFGSCPTLKLASILLGNRFMIPPSRGPWTLIIGSTLPDTTCGGRYSAARSVAERPDSLGVSSSSFFFRCFILSALAAVGDGHVRSLYCASHAAAVRRLPIFRAIIVQLPSPSSCTSTASWTHSSSVHGRSTAALRPDALPYIWRVSAASAAKCADLLCSSSSDELSESSSSLSDSDSASVLRSDSSSKTDGETIASSSDIETRPSSDSVGDTTSCSGWLTGGASGEVGRGLH